MSASSGAAEEVAGWEQLPSGVAELAAAGSPPGGLARLERVLCADVAEPSLDVHGIAGGSPMLRSTRDPVEAHANLSIRLVAGQRPDVIAPAVKRLREAAPDGAEVTVELWSQAPPALVRRTRARSHLGLDAFKRVLGVRPLLVRSGGAIPLVSALAGHGVPTVVTGFALSDSNIHSPNERLPPSTWLSASRRRASSSGVCALG